MQRLAAGSISYVMLGAAAGDVGDYDTILELEADGEWSWKPVGPGTQPGEENVVDRRPRCAGAGADSGEPMEQTR